ncbi:MAG: hypothetical protein M1424_05720 [Candidatus Thermoplasmatota archaeon]|nr:hypothetical protein [Candidatus Thermoplasmatota archaeon]
MKEYGLQVMLERHLTRAESNAILSLVICKIVRPLLMRSLGSRYEGTHMSEVLPADLSSQNISRLMEKIGESSLYRVYSLIPLFEYGNSKDHPELEQFQFSLTLERKRRIPISYDVHPGSIPDVVTQERTLEFLTPLVPDIIMILDRGFFSLHNIMALQNVQFIVAASLQRKEMKAAFSLASRIVDRADNVLIYGDKTLFCQPFTMRMEGLELSGYFYHDPSRESDERLDFHRKLAERRESIENLQIRRGLRRTIESIAGDFLKYIRYRVENGRIITTARNNRSLQRRTAWAGSCLWATLRSLRWNASPSTGRRTG